MPKFTLWSAALALAGLSAAAHAGLLPATATPFEQCADVPGMSIEGFTAPAAKKGDGAEMARLHAWLTSEAAVQAKRAPLSVTLSNQERFNIGEISECDECAPVQSQERRKLVGLAKPVDMLVDLGQAAAKKGSGVSRTTDGGLVWTLPVHSKGAQALRIGFGGLDLPVGAELYVYNQAGEAFGPYSGRGMNGSGTLVSNTITGDTAFVQLRMHGEPTAADLAQLKFRITDIGHIGPEFELSRRLNAAMSGAKQGECSYNASCVINGECASGWSHLSNTRAAVAHMLFASGGGYYICSGGLLNNTRNDGTPLFLTANHCIGSSGEANSLEAFFDFRADSCSDTSWCTASYTTLRNSLHTTLGATLLASGTSGDYSLMQLAAVPGGTRHYMGWSTTPVATSDGTDLFRLSHPGGAPQSWSTHDVNANDFTCRTLSRGTFIYSNDSAGATEGGSSGSPVLNANGQVVGQLYGACGSNLNDTCDAVNNQTVDGALAAYFPNVEAWLDPSGGGDPGGEVVASVQSVTVSVNNKGPWHNFSASVRIVDQDGNPVSSATVSGNWSGAVSGSASGTTDGSGVAKVNGGKTRNSGSATFCVTGVSGSGISFDGTSVCDSGG